jgi:hypothetical protein
VWGLFGLLVGVVGGGWVWGVVWVGVWGVVVGVWGCGCGCLVVVVVCFVVGLVFVFFDDLGWGVEIVLFYWVFGGYWLLEV